METEICRREYKKPQNFKLAIYASLALAWIAASVNFIVGLSIWGDEIFYGFSRYGEYWIGWGIGILGLVAAGVFALLQYVLSKNISLALTNKRIYYTFSTKSLFSKSKTLVISYNLNQITSYILLTLTKKETIAYFLELNTPDDRDRFIVDQKFYNEFVNAVNATIPTMDN